MNPVSRLVLLLPLALACLRLPAEPAGGSGFSPPAQARKTLGALAADAQRELRGNILPFWLKYTRNPANGGYYGLIDAHMRVHADAPRGALLTSRILWTFSKAYETCHDPEYLAMARWAYRDLTEHFFDPRHGGLYWTIAADGKPADTHKQVYGQVFGIYGLAEYYAATGDRGALNRAIGLYRLMERRCRDRVNGGYFDSFDREWRVSAVNLLGPGPKTQNSHIHILEAYTNLLRVWPDPGLRRSERKLIDLILTRILNPQTHHLILYQLADWTPVSDAISYGHDIELSWLITEAARVLGDPALEARVRPIALAIAATTLAQGVDKDGGIIDEASPQGYTDTHKDWWQQAEAVTGFLNAYQLSGEPRYLAASRRSWGYIQAHFVDRVHGDWIERVTRSGVPVPTAKVSLWKCASHSRRCCFLLMERGARLLPAPTGAAPAR